MELKKSQDSFDHGRPRGNTYNHKDIGRFKVLCSGRATVSASWCNSVWSYVLILPPSILQMIYINTAFKDGCTVFLQILYLITLAGALLNLLFTTCSDPGVIPKPTAYSDYNSSEFAEPGSSKSSLLPSKMGKKSKSIHASEEDDLEISKANDITNTFTTSTQ